MRATKRQLENALVDYYDAVRKLHKRMEQSGNAHYVEVTKIGWEIFADEVNRITGSLNVINGCGDAKKITVKTIRGVRKIL